MKNKRKTCQRKKECGKWRNKTESWRIHTKETGTANNTDEIKGKTENKQHKNRKTKKKQGKNGNEQLKKKWRSRKQRKKRKTKTRNLKKKTYKTRTEETQNTVKSENNEEKNNITKTWKQTVKHEQHASRIVQFISPLKAPSCETLAKKKVYKKKKSKCK